jgi:hypothetical protein
MQEAGVAAALAPALAQDTQRVFQQLGVQTLRVSLLDGHSFDAQSSCAIDEQGQVQESDLQRPSDSVFPGGAAHLAELMQASDVVTSVRKLSPRQWLLAWRLQDGHAVVVDAKFHDKCDVLSEADQAVIRLVCNTSFGRLRDHSADLTDNKHTMALVWPQVERRARNTPTAAGWLPLGLAAATWLGSVVLMFVAVPQAMQNLQALHTEHKALQEGTMTRGLSAALATGDYGEVQLALQTFYDLGQVESAVVTNEKQRAVALVGGVKNQRIGEPVVPGYATAASALRLATGSQQHGQLLYQLPARADSNGSGTLLWWGAAWVLLTSLALLAQQLWSRRRSGG